ncbi:MAG: hypothetical protein ACR2MP_32370 [Streptosporangiaceae bacterium]
MSTAGISLARAGLDLTGAHLGGLAARHAVVLGTGSMRKLAARLLREAGVGQLSVASSTASRAAQLAATVRGRPLRASDAPRRPCRCRPPGHGHRGRRAGRARRAGARGPGTDR